MASDSETFKLLLEQMAKLNHNLESASFATNNLTMQITSQIGDTAAPSSGPSTSPIRTNKVKQAPSNGQRVLGYVNWNESHEALKSQRLVKMSSIRVGLEKVILNSEARSKQTDANSKALANYSGQRAISGHFTFSGITPKVDRDTRFPMDAVYIDVESPAVKEEIEFMNKLNVPAPEGVAERFLHIVESEMHTCETFEKFHGLKWA